MAIVANYIRYFVDQNGNSLGCSITGWARWQNGSNDFYDYPVNLQNDSYGNLISVDGGFATVSGDIDVTYEGVTKNLTWSVTATTESVTDSGNLVFTVPPEKPINPIKAINPTPVDEAFDISRNLGNLTWEAGV